jgi:acetyl-CoA carboxylase carboxyltransferase component
VVHNHHPQRLWRRRRRASAGGAFVAALCVAVGELGSLPLEGGIEAAYRAEIDAAGDPQAKLGEIEDRLNKLRSPFRTAEKFWVEEIIDPRETRPLLCDFARIAEPVLTPGPVHFSMRP